MLILDNCIVDAQQDFMADQPDKTGLAVCDWRRCAL
jgi:hypothetical protein